MKRLLIFVPFLLNASLLSTLKQQELNYDQSINQEESKKNYKSWINPIVLKYSVNQDNAKEVVTRTRTFTISINQPIFKSGAIYYSIKYAKNLKKLNEFQNQKKRIELIQKAYDLAIDYKKTLLNKKILELKIKNALIDVDRKKEEFLNGTLDSSFLDNAILNLNNLKLSLEDLKTTLKTLKLNFSNISDLDIKKVKIPKISLVSKSEFITHNIDTKISKQQIEVDQNMYKMKKGNSLLTIAFMANYNHQNISFEDKSDTKNFYNVGLSFSLPISFNSKNDIQKSKLSYLKSKLLFEDKKRVLLNEYKLSLKKLNSLSKKEKIYKENVDVYKSLINSTLENIKAGTKTQLDLEVLENSLKIMKLNLKMLQLEKTKILLDLYVRSRDEFSKHFN